MTVCLNHDPYAVRYHINLNSAISSGNVSSSGFFFLFLSFWWRLLVCFFCSNFLFPILKVNETSNLSSLLTSALSKLFYPIYEVNRHKNQNNNGSKILIIDIHAIHLSYPPLLFFLPSILTFYSFFLLTEVFHL